MDDNDITFNSDNDYISNLDGKTYLGAVSPWFFTVSSYVLVATCLLKTRCIQHYTGKNFIYRFDDWLFSNRWELLIANRNQVPIVEVVTWNGTPPSVFDH
jgi:glucan endo-1,3-alpha-glucosidase